MKIDQSIIDQADNVITTTLEEFASTTSGMLKAIGQGKLKHTGYYTADVNGVKTLWIRK